MAFCDDENNTKSAWLNYEPHVAGGHLVCVARLHWYLHNKHQGEHDYSCILST